jgi:hypothetical protein
MPRSQLIALLAVAFALRLVYGLASELFGPDEVQIFLIGLQYYTTGAWPLYGPDVVYTHTQLPGALQGLLVGGPLFLVAQPEAPYVVLNLLSLGALALLAWYIGRRLPQVPRWFLWPWVFFSPWTLCYSTHIINQSYVLPSAILFFVGAYEIVPALRIGALSMRTAFICLGAGLLCMTQLHLSAALLGVVAVIALALLARRDRRALVAGFPWLAAGALLGGLTLIPTLVHDGLGALKAYAGSNVQSEPASLLYVPALVARFFSFGSFEMARFIGGNTEQRIDFLFQFPWAAPFVVIASAFGVAQTVWLVVSLFRPQRDSAHWAGVCAATLMLLLLAAAAFMLSVKGPASHVLYALLPAVLIYAFYCWAPLLARPAGRRAAIALLVCGAVSLTALGIRNFNLRSLYTNRPLVMRAIIEKNHRLVGERRPDVWRAEGR